MEWHTSRPLPVLLAFSLLLLGLLGPWIIFPFSESIFLLKNAPFKNLSTIYFFFLAITAIGWLTQGKIMFSIGLLGVSMLIVLFYLLLLSGNWQWLENFLVESDERLMLESFLEDRYFPNLNPQPTLQMINEFDGLLSRISLVWKIAGWGWILSLSGLCLLVITAFFSDRLRIATLYVFVVSLIGFFTYMAPMIEAEHSIRRADDLLARGKPHEAIVHYRNAMTKDPSLRLSKPFLRRSSRAFSQIYGENSELSTLYFISFYGGEQLSKGLLGKIKRIGEPSQALPLSNDATFDDGLLIDAIQRYSILYKSRLSVSKSVAHVNEEQYASALQDIKNALEIDNDNVFSRFLLAHIQLHLGEYVEAETNLTYGLMFISRRSTRAHFICSIGDANRLSKKTLEAREAYTQCLNSDSTWNYRAVMRLAGI